MTLLEDRELQDVTQRLKELRNACGCGEAAAGMLTGLGLAVFIVSRHGILGMSDALFAAGTAIALALTGVVIGKLIGVGVARLRWVIQRRRVVERILERAKRSGHGILR